MRRRWVAVGLGTGRTKWFRTGIATLALAASAAPLGAAHAAGGGDGATTTYVVHGTVMPLGMQFSFVGCDSLVQRTPETLQPTVALGPGTPPLGTRSLGYSLKGGNALGSLAYVPAVGTTPVSIAVYPADAGDGPDGVAYVGYRSPKQAADRMWLGRASLDEPAGTWSTVDASTLSFTWSQVTVASGLPVLTSGTTGVPATVGDFTARHGDGPGFVTMGFGCNGVTFNIDALRAGNSVYDLEGLETHVSISGSASTVHAGDSVTLTGALRDSTGARVPGGVLVLEERVGTGDWTPVRVMDASTTDPSVTVTPTATTSYRFRSLDRPLAASTQSATYVVTAPPTTVKPSSSPTPSPTAEASPSTPAAPTSSPPTQAPPSTQPAPSKPATRPSARATSRPSARATSQPSATSSAKPSSKPSPSTSASPSATPSAGATAAASAATAASGG